MKPTGVVLVLCMAVALAALGPRSCTAAGLRALHAAQPQTKCKGQCPKQGTLNVKTSSCSVNANNSDGTCVITCDDGFANLDGLTSNGCEASAAAGGRGSNTWRWSFGGESGTLVTNVSVPAGQAPPAGTYEITDLVYTTSAITTPASPAGFSMSGGQITLTQPAQGFVWDGAQATLFYRSSGEFLNGANFFFNLAADYVRMLFYCGSGSCVAWVDQPQTFAKYAQAAPLVLQAI